MHPLRNYIGIGAGMLLLVACQPKTADTPGAGSEIVIGATIPLSGALASFGSFQKWGYEHAVERTVDVHVRRLRAKIGAHVPVVTTVYGVGTFLMRAATSSKRPTPVALSV